MRQTKDNTADTKATTRTTIMKNLYWIPIATGFVIAIFSPTDVMNYSAVRAGVGFVSIFVPMMSKLNGQYELAHVAQFFFAVMWALTPLSFLAAKHHLNEEKFIIGVKKHKLLMTIFITLTPPLMIIIFFFIGFDPSSLDGKDYIVLHSRVGMATYGWATVHGCAFGLRIMVTWKKLFWDIYSQGSNQ